MSGLLLKYFVLKPKGGDIYAAASRKAMRAYATHVREANKQLSDELRDWADNEQADALTAPQETLQRGTPPPLTESALVDDADIQRPKEPK